MKYVFLQNNVVVDVARVDPFKIFYPNYAAQFVEAPEEVTHFWTWDGEKFNPPPPPQAEVEPPKPTKEQLLAQLQALQQQIQSLE